MAGTRGRFRRSTQATRQFYRWCDRHELSLNQLTPVPVAAYIEGLGQYLAALRMLFAYLVTDQVMPTNPTYAARGPKQVAKTGRTPVLSAEEARVLLDRSDVRTITELRDRALIGVMAYSFARVGAVTGMNVEDYFQDAIPLDEIERILI